MKKLVAIVWGMLVCVVVYGQSVTYYFDKNKEVTLGQLTQLERESFRVETDKNHPRCQRSCTRYVDVDDYGGGKCVEWQHEFRLQAVQFFFGINGLSVGSSSITVSATKKRKRFVRYISSNDTNYCNVDIESTYSSKDIDFDNGQYRDSEEVDIKFASVDFSLYETTKVLCVGQEFLVGDVLRNFDDAEPINNWVYGETWSGPNLYRYDEGSNKGRRYFKADTPGNYTIRVTRNFINGPTTLTLTIIVPDAGVNPGIGIRVCHANEFYQLEYNDLWKEGSGQTPRKNDEVANNGKVTNAYFQGDVVRDRNENGQRIGQYVDVTKNSGRDYTITYVVDVDYPGNQCSFSVDKIVTIESVPTRTAGYPIAVCQGDVNPVALDEGATVNGEIEKWKVEGLTDKGKVDQRKNTVDVSGLGKGVYTVTLDYYNSNCFSVHTKTLTVNDTPEKLTFPGTAMCGSGLITLSADRISKGYGEGNTVIWYESESERGEIGRLNGAVQVENTRTWWVAQQNSEGCFSPRSKDGVTVYPIPEVDDFAYSRCGNGEISVDLNADSDFDGWAAQWYELNLGGEALNNNFTYRENFEDPLTYRYVAFTDPNGCTPKERVLVKFQVFPRPDKPGVSNSGVCGSGKVTFEAPLLPTSGDTYVWYALAKDKDILGEGLTFATDPLADTTTYYVAVRASKESGGCESERQRLTAFVYPTPPPLTLSNLELCGAGEVTLSVDRAKESLLPYHTIVWYSEEDEGEEVGRASEVVQIDSSLIWWAAQQSAQGCLSARTKDTITVYPVPESPVIAKFFGCGNLIDPVDFSINLNAEGRFDGWAVEWYELNLGGEILDDDFSYSESFIDPVNYRYVAFTDPNGCAPLQRSRIVFRIGAKPNRPRIADAGVCGSGAVTFTAPALALGEYVWYETVRSALVIGEGIDFATPELANTKTYYPAIRIGGVGTTCESDRDTVAAFVWPVPAALAERTVSRCGRGVIGFEDVSAATERGVVAWFAEADNGERLKGGETFRTPLLEETTTYYIRERSEKGCLSAPATVTAEIKPIAAIDIGEDVSLCLGAAPVLLDELLPSNINPNQGVFTGTGTSESDGKTYFYPNIARPGEHLVTFSLNGDNDNLYEAYCLTPGKKRFTITEVGEADTTGFVIAADKEEVYFGDWVQFQLKDGNNTGAIIVDYRWALGDSHTGDKVAPVYYYYDKGRKDVAVTATLEGGCSFTLNVPGLVNVLGWKTGDEYNPDDIVTAVEADGLDKDGVQLWPNPVADRLYVSRREDTRYALYTVQGKVKEGLLRKGYGNIASIDMSDLASGLYYLKYANKWYAVWKQ